MSLQRYQLAVVGAGSAGLASAALAAELGASVALIERHRIGGDRLRYRVPAALLIRAARDRAADDAGALFKRTRDLSEVAARVQSLRDLGVDLVYGEARFVAADALEVAGRRIEFRRALIATGARTAVPRIPGLGDLAFRTPETLFELTELPGRFGVLGAGSRGCEMAQAFTDLGSEVHLFVAGDRLLPGRDLDAAEIVAAAMRSSGIELHMGARDLEVRQRQNEVRVALPDGRGEIAVDELLVATGPIPNVERLGLEAAGVSYDLSGIEVDRGLRTTNRRIYAAGGVVAPEGKKRNVAPEGNQRNIAPERETPSGLAADADARTAVRNALLFRHLARRRRTVPRVTYTRPEVARVGLGAGEAASDTDVETLTVPLADADRGELFGAEGAARSGRDAGFLRLHLKRRNGKILGGTLVAERAAELIGPLAMAVHQRMSLGVFAEIPLPHPTRGEIYRRAAFVWRRRRARRQSRRFWPSAADLVGLWLKLSSRF